jgi:release factor glutamine methyltransferase
MSVSSSPHPHPDVVARLRAAGCVFAEDEARMLAAEARTPADLAAMVERRAGGLPLEQVLGWAGFCGLRITLAPGVFVPRRRTEFLARQAIALARRAGGSPVPVIVDLCCGSGAIGAALAAALGPVELHAADTDPAAVRCARGNLAAAGGRVYQGDLYAPLPAGLRGRVDVLVANVPYVPSAEVGLRPAAARVHEPRAALDGGTDGLSVLRRVAAEAPRWLAPGGHLLVESSQRQAAQAAAAVTQAGLTAQVATSAELGTAVTTGTKATGTRATGTRATGTRATGTRATATRADGTGGQWPGAGA